MIIWHIYLKNQENWEALKVRDKVTCLCQKCSAETIVQISNLKKQVLKHKNYYCRACAASLGFVKGLEKYKNTMLVKYGVDNPLKNAQVKDKVKKTSELRYGKGGSIAKARAKFFDKYGHSNPMLLPESKEKIKRTTLKHHGVESFLMLEEVRAKGNGVLKKRRDLVRGFSLPTIPWSSSEKNLEELKLWRRAYDKANNKNPKVVFKRVIYGALSRIIRNKKISKTNLFYKLGYSYKDFKQHISSLFLPGMSWDNYGQWHIDHIRPLSSFDFSDESNILRANELSNLQPLWAIDNLKKKNKY